MKRSESAKRAEKNKKEENAERFEAKTTEEGFPPKARRRKKDKIWDPSGS